MSKKVNPWVEHVKKYAKENNLSYMCAVQEARKSYEKPVKIGKRQQLNEKEERYIKEYEASGDLDARDALLAKRAKRDKRKEQKEANTNPLAKYTTEKLKAEFEKLTEKIKSAKGDDIYYLTEIQNDIRQALFLRGRKDKKIDYSKKTLEELNEEYNKQIEMASDTKNADLLEAIQINIKLIQSVMKDKKKAIKDKQKKQKKN